MGFSTFDLVTTALESPALAGARAAKDLAATLNAGFTSIREPGGYAIDIAKAIEEGWLPGPHVYGCGAVLSQTAGHGDMHGLPLSTVQRNNQEWSVAHVCDGVDECIKAVRQQIRRGAQCMKLCSTGGVLSQIDSPRAPQFSPAELKAMVEEADRVGVTVAAHAHGKEGIMNALRAGVHTIEHGSYLDEEAIELMKEKGAIFVATRSIVAYGAVNSHLLPAAQRAKMIEIAEQHKKAYALAVKSGVRIALGTDLGVSSPTIHFNHGMNGQEFYWATEAGMTPLEAIEAGTATAPEVLGLRAPKSGQLKEGYDADFIALNISPLDNIKVLGAARNVTHVWKDGILCKEPGRPVGLV